MRRICRLSGILLVLGLLVSCGSKSTSVVDAQLPGDLTEVRSVRIFFGHQSVGRNILDGVERIAGQAKMPVRIVAVGAVLPDGGRLADGEIGRNGDPASKCQAKFCFVDFDRDSRPDEVLAAYAHTIDELRKQFPNVVFVHATAPLKVSFSGIRRVLRDLLGRTAEPRAANRKRSQFKELLRKRYRGEPLFDLAAAESTRPDGGRESFTVESGLGFSRAPDYRSDGGHLNEFGSERAARELIRVLAAAAPHRN